MSQLKPSFIKDIRDELGKSKFTLSDFQIELPSSGRILLRIVFVHKPAYCFILFEDTKEESIKLETAFRLSRTEKVKEIVFSLKAMPGGYKLEDSTELDSIGHVLVEIPKWCENIRRDLYALVPNIDPLEQIRQQLHQNLDGILDDPNGYFTPDELNVVDERFNKLYEDIASLREQYSITKQQLTQLRAEVEEFKSSARAYPKGMWARITSNKLVKATGEIINSTEGRTFLFQQIRRALGFAEDA